MKRSPITTLNQLGERGLGSNFCDISVGKRFLLWENSSSVRNTPGKRHPLYILPLPRLLPSQIALFVEFGFIKEWQPLPSANLNLLSSIWLWLKKPVPKWVALVSGNMGTKTCDLPRSFNFEPLGISFQGAKQKVGQAFSSCVVRLFLCQL